MANKRVTVLVFREDNTKILRRMTKKEFAEAYTILQDSAGKPLTFADAKDIADLNKFQGAIVIDGDIVKPKPVTRYEL